MKLSTRARYGLRALLCIARKEGRTPISLREIVQEEGISKAYLGQLILLLQEGGLVRSVRGKEGGFLLTKSPEEMNLLEVIKVLERPFTLVECAKGSTVCPRQDRCVTTKLWRHLWGLLEGELSRLTLKDLMEWE